MRAVARAFPRRFRRPGDVQPIGPQGAAGHSMASLSGAYVGAVFTVFLL
jgi:hypothetical protein